MLVGRVLTDGRLNARVKCDLTDNLTLKINAQVIQVLNFCCSSFILLSGKILNSFFLEPDNILLFCLPAHKWTSFFSRHVQFRLQGQFALCIENILTVLPLYDLKCYELLLCLSFSVVKSWSEFDTNGQMVNENLLDYFLLYLVW